MIPFVFTNIRSAALAVAALTLVAGAAQAQSPYRLDTAYPGKPLAGPAAAKGAIIWSHGRSVDSEDSLSPTPSYMEVLREAGWDTFRFDRMRVADTLQDSSRILVGYVSALKHRGYRSVVLTGQSFGAFLSLMAADASDDIHAVVATSPAAYGTFQDYYQSWENNATQLYPLLEKVRSARVMLFYFHGDDFDPGGRGDRSKAILTARNIDNLVIDQPPQLTTHWAANTPLFVHRFAGCIRDFIEAADTATITCNSRWRQSPVKQIALPAPASGGRTADLSGRAAIFAGKWQGHYGDGREVLFTLDQIAGNEVSAIYAVGAGAGEPSQWARRQGRVIGDELIFNQKGLPTLRYRLGDDGKLHAWWISADGRRTVEATLSHTDWPGTITASAGR